MLYEPQVGLEADLIGPQQCCRTSWVAEVTNRGQELFQAFMVIDHIRRQDVVVATAVAREVPVQVLAPGEGRHLRCVPGAAPGVPCEVKGQVGEDVGQVGGRDPGPWRTAHTRGKPSVRQSVRQSVWQSESYVNSCETRTPLSRQSR